EFFRKTWEEPSTTEKYEYRVYLSQICSNLNELFFARSIGEMDEMNRTRLTRIHKTTFIAPSGLLTQAKILADYYEKNGRFPKILVVDLLLTTGEPYVEMMIAISKAILEESGLKADLNNIWDYWTEIEKATTYTSFMQSKDDPLLAPMMKKSMYENRVSAEEYFGIWVRLEASVVYSDVVQHGDFLPTFWISQDKYKDISEKLLDKNHPSGWRKEMWRYWNKTAFVWQKSLSGVRRGIYAQRAIRCNFCTDMQKYAITPLLLWRSLYNERMYAGLVSAMTNTGIPEFNPLIKVLASQRQYMADTKLKLAITIGSMLTFCQFAGGVGDTETFANNSDIEKISGHFGRPEDFAPALEALFSSKEANSLRKKLWEILTRALEQYAEPLSGESRCDTRNGKDFYLNVAVDHLVEQNTNRQKLIIYRREHKIQFGPSSWFYESTGFLEDYLADFPPDYTYLDGKIGALMMLLMWDIAELTVHRKLNDGEDNGHSAIYLRDV
ncbi:MAG: hypothetical protein Q4F61_03785, partial [Candidatus Saccharibacteria bacterium]|nr:hypothetical protein [Candidatus Saccharibacteria bacterium]